MIMRYFVFILVLCVAGCVSTPSRLGVEGVLDFVPEDFLERAVVGPQGDGTYVVPTTQIVDPAGESVHFPGRPTGLALSPDESVLAVKNKDDIVFIDVATRAIRQTLPMKTGGNSFCGIIWSRDGKTVWTTSATKYLCAATVGEDGKFQWTDAIKLPGPKGKDNSAPGGFAVDEDKGLIYVAMSRNNAVGVVECLFAGIRPM